MTTEYGVSTLNSTNESVLALLAEYGVPHVNTLLHAWYAMLLYCSMQAAAALLCIGSPEHLQHMTCLQSTPTPYTLPLLLTTANNTQFTPHRAQLSWHDPENQLQGPSEPS